jgi:hypothetical protein
MGIPANVQCASLIGVQQTKGHLLTAICPRHISITIAGKAQHLSICLFQGNVRIS